MGKAYLILENGRIFEGESFGAAGEAAGEIVFTTAMTGYLETLTDPGFLGQIVVQTFPLIGNYGIIPSDFESKSPHLNAYIVREWCQEPSNFRSEGDLDTFLKQNGIVGLCGVDTRAITRVVREYGAMNAVVTNRPNPEKTKALLRNHGNITPAGISGSRDPFTLMPERASFHVALLDLGAKNSVAGELVKRGCGVTVFGARTGAREILFAEPDGVLLAGGPGDPRDNPSIIEEIRTLTRRNIPMFGIGLGHQLLALSQGARCEKMKHGHRGESQPVVDLSSGKVYITSQNHGYVIVNASLPRGAAERFINANDKTCEGISYDKMPAFSVQFHPEACGGPLDTRFLFDRFISLMQEVHCNAVK